MIRPNLDSIFWFLLITFVFVCRAVCVLEYAGKWLFHAVTRRGEKPRFDL